MKTLNTTVHHEMIAPLRTNVQICQKLLIQLKSSSETQLVGLMLVASQMILMHANDLLDWRIIENGSFVANITINPICCALKEMIDLMNSTLVNRNLTIVEKFSRKILSLAKFDKRRF